MKVYEIQDNMERAYYAGLDESSVRQEAEFDGFETIGHIRELADSELDTVKVELTDEDDAPTGEIQTLREYIAAEMYTDANCPVQLCVIEL